MVICLTVIQRKVFQIRILFRAMVNNILEVTVANSCNAINKITKIEPEIKHQKNKSYMKVK